MSFYNGFEPTLYIISAQPSMNRFAYGKIYGHDYKMTLTVNNDSTSTIAIESVMGYSSGCIINIHSSNIPNITITRD